MLQERRLADPRLATQHQHAAPPVTHRGNQALKRLGLVVPPHQGTKRLNCPIYILVVVGPVGYLLNQNAFQQGTFLSPVQAIITAANPVLSIALGIVWLDVRVRSSPAAIAGEVASLLLMIVRDSRRFREFSPGHRTRGGNADRPATGSRVSPYGKKNAGERTEVRARLSLSGVSPSFAPVSLRGVSPSFVSLARRIRPDRQPSDKKVFLDKKSCRMAGLSDDRCSSDRRSGRGGGRTGSGAGPLAGSAHRTAIGGHARRRGRPAAAEGQLSPANAGAIWAGRVVEERRKGNVTERLLRAAAASYVISPSALAAVAPDPARAPDRLSARWRRAGPPPKPQTGLPRRRPLLKKKKRPRHRAAFTGELVQAVTSLVAKYHDERAEGGREHHLVIAVHPNVTAVTAAETEET